MGYGVPQIMDVEISDALHSSMRKYLDQFIYLYYDTRSLQRMLLSLQPILCVIQIFSVLCLKLAPLSYCVVHQEVERL